MRREFRSNSDDLLFHLPVSCLDEDSGIVRHGLLILAFKSYAGVAQNEIFVSGYFFGGLFLFFLNLNGVLIKMLKMASIDM